MALRPRPQKCTLGLGTPPLVIYCVPDQIAPFVGTVTPDVDGDPVEVTQTVTSHSRRRYPGADPVTVDGHDRERLVGGYAAKQTLPGRNAWFERTTGTGPSAVRTVRQITFTGTTAQLRNFAESNAVGVFTLRTADGEPVPLSV